MQPISSRNDSYPVTPVEGAGKAGTEPSKQGQSAAWVGVKVELSAQGLNKASGSKRNQDIDNSDLPKQIQALLKMIRELKQQLAGKMAELQAALTDPGLGEEQRQLRAQGLQSAVSSLNGALSAANASLVKAMEDSGLSAEQMLAAMALI